MPTLASKKQKLPEATLRSTRFSTPFNKGSGDDQMSMGKLASVPQVHLCCSVGIASGPRDNHMAPLDYENINSWITLNADIRAPESDSMRDR
ncbi:hypothetical protein CGRA01v4_05867 [Colletotrichum graminicola]|nr:hypothetical protein CGRA01v4_05867 [Colletotrichum graminicola]